MKNNLSLYELNKFYLSFESKRDFDIALRCGVSTINDRLIEFKNNKKTSTPGKKISEWSKYKASVWAITISQDLKVLPNYFNRGFTNYHIDHKVSIYHGFRKGIPAKQIGEVCNLRMIPASLNLLKGTKSCIDEYNMHLKKYFSDENDYTLCGE